MFKNVDKSNVQEYYDKIIDMLSLIEGKHNEIVRNMFYGTFKQKMFARGLLNKRTRKYFFNRLMG